MNSSIKQLSPFQLEIEAELSWPEFELFVEKALLNWQKNSKMQGFRPGKVPKSIVEKEVGENNIIADAADLAIKEKYPQLIKENKMEVIGHPEVDIIKLAKGNPFIFKARVSVLPKIKLPEYRKIASKTERKKIEASESEVEDTIKWLQQSRPKLTVKNSGAEKKDFVEIEYSCSQIAGLNKESPQQDSFLLGDGHFIAGFEDNLSGMKANEEKTFFLESKPQKEGIIPQGKLEFKVKMKSVQKAEFPEINDQFAQGFGNFPDMDALKKNIKEGIIKEKEEAETQRRRAEILQKISREIACEIPDMIAKAEQERMLHDLQHRAKDHLKVSFEEYLARLKKTEKEVADSFLAEAKNRVKNFMILKEIAQNENITIEDSELAEEMNKVFKQYFDARTAQKNLDPEKLREYTKEALKQEKIFQFLENLA